ncbi:MAG: uracil permease [Symbiobacteriia bacterium]
MSRRTIDVNERLPLLQSIPLSLQHLFAMFGATVLVPILTGFDPSVALFTGGVGTLIYILVTKGKVPAYLGSSFAVITGFALINKTWGDPHAAMAGALALGLVYVAVALLVGAIGIKWLDRLFPPVVIGSVVAIIGLGLAGVAVNMAGLTPNSGIPAGKETAWVLTSVFTLLVVVVGSVRFKKFLGIIPILVGIIAGYVFALLMGLVNFKPVVDARWFALPHFVTPAWTPHSAAAALLMAPIAIVLITEHIGHLLVTNKIVGRDFTKDPGLHRSLLGDGLASTFAALVGGPSATTYGENIGVLAITRVFSVWVLGGAAVIAIVLSFVQKLGALIGTIPQPVMGGVSIALFGVIAAAGTRLFVEAKVDFSNKRNLMLASVILVLGVGGASLHFGSFTLDGLTLATVVGVLLNLALPEAVDEAEIGETAAAAQGSSRAQVAATKE